LSVVFGFAQPCDYLRTVYATSAFHFTPLGDGGTTHLRHAAIFGTSVAEFAWRSPTNAAKDAFSVDLRLAIQAGCFDFATE